MALSYEAAAALFNRGEFAQLISLSGSEKERRQLPPPHRVIAAEALVLTGAYSEARVLLELDRHSPAPANVRARAEGGLALLSRREGDAEAALNHAQCAVQTAQESGDIEQIAWARLHLFRLLIDRGRLDTAFAEIPNVRRSVAKAGTRQATAYLHICVAVLEAQMGRLNEAQRHCKIAESLARDSANVWLESGALNVRGCIECLRCEFDSAIASLRDARDMARRSGHAYLMRAAAASLGHIHLLTGQFEKAHEALSSVADDAQSDAMAKLASQESLVRVYLATDQLDAAERLIQHIYADAHGDEGAIATYQVRWTALAEARLFIKRGAVDKALQSLVRVEEKFRRTGDVPLSGCVHLTLAHAHSLIGAHAECARRILAANELDITRIQDLRAQYYYVCGLVAAESNSALAAQCRRRAIALWRDQGIVSIQFEIDALKRAPIELDATFENCPQLTDSVLDTLTAVLDLGDKPRLMAAEMIEAIGRLQCSSGASVMEVSEKAKPFGTSDVTYFELGTERAKKLVLVCKVPQSPAKAIVLANVLQAGRIALEVAHARDAERTRAAVWPSNPAQEQAGALFLAEEMQTLLATARRIATTTVPVLITGETGTGKEVLARTIHAYSARSSATFLPFNCSSVPRDMLDSQLFGHRRGSFTGATDNFPGVIRAAGGGTLFLDEIGETTLEVQPKLLRFLDSSEVHPIGETQPLKTDVRIIAATNVDLDALVAQGRFREDLFYRLNVVRFHVPPLRERRVEIPALATHYLQKHAQEYRKGDLRIAEETMEYLVLYRWPGNVRQLANEMRRLAALAETGAVLMPEHLSRDIAASRRTVAPSERALDSTEVAVRIDQPVPAAIEHLERAMIQYALRACGGRMEETAAMLGLSRKGLYLKRVRYGLEPPQGATAAEVA